MKIITMQERTKNERHKPQPYPLIPGDYEEFFETWNAEKRGVQVVYSAVTSRRLKFSKKELESELEQTPIVDGEEELR